MKSPFKGANDFNVNLKFQNCPEDFEKYADLSTTDLLDKSNYRFYAIVSDDGIIDYEYEFHMPGFKTRKDSEKADSLKETKENINKKINVGDFLIYLYAIQKEHRWLKSSNINKKDWDEWAGVSVYRDGIRILPYGEKGNDWLNLDNRRIQKPGELISNDQVIGMIEINQESNIHLKDKTNREGLIENEYYEKFRSLIMAAFTIFENTLYDDRQKLAPKKEKTSNEEIEQKVNDVKANLDEIKTTVEASDKYTANIAKPIINKVEQNIVDLKQQVTDTIDELEKDRQVLFNLAGTGLAAERFTHEFARMISGTLSSFERLKKLIDLEEAKIKKEVNSISSALEALRNDIRLLGPMFYIKKVAKERELDIKDIIQNTISLQEHFIERENIKVDVHGEGFKVFMREGSCMQVFNNLLDNSIFWCSRKSETDKKQIKFIIDCKEKTVYVSDSGSGVAARYKDKIFNPFFSTKGEDGRGLGLYIAKEILDEKNFGIYLVTQDDYSGLLPGANFKIVFVGNEENNEKNSDN
jgi:C4-dicarboxylate-specific signal transduction histidine kinase